jgi:hypothetical protein
VRGLEAPPDFSGYSGPYKIVELNEQITAAQLRDTLRRHQLGLGSLDVTKDQRVAGRRNHGAQGVRRAKAELVDPRADSVERGEPVLQCSSARVGFKRHDMGARDPFCQPDRVVAFPRSDVDDRRVVKVDDLLDDGMKLELVSAEQLGPILAPGRFVDVLQTGKRTGDRAQSRESLQRLQLSLLSPVARVQGCRRDRLCVHRQNCEPDRSWQYPSGQAKRNEARRPKRLPLRAVPSPVPTIGYSLRPLRSVPPSGTIARQRAVSDRRLDWCGQGHDCSSPIPPPASYQ